MSGFDRTNRRDYSNFDKMSTDELKELLRQDSYLEEDEKSDYDAMLYITEVILEREGKDKAAEAAETEAAWKQFKEKYMPQDCDGRSLYDLDDEDDEPAQKSAAVLLPRKTPRGLKWLVGVAAAVAVLVIGTVTAKAFGFDIWDALISWGRETFNISRGEPDGEKVIPEELKELADVLIKNGVASKLLPSYIPEGYTAIDVGTIEMDNSTIVSCFLEKGEGNIVLQYTVYSSEQNLADIQKNDPAPEFYEHGGRQFYIVNNYDEFDVSWVEGNVEGTIYGLSTRDELIKIIDSIGG